MQQTYNECIEVLATICRTISLATLSLCFPAARLWQFADMQESSNDYVKYYLGKICAHRFTPKAFLLNEWATVMFKTYEICTKSHVMKS